MGDYKVNSFKSQLKLFMETQPGLPQSFRQRLAFESNKMKNHFQFLGNLLSKGVLCDGPNDSEAMLGLKALMIQLGGMVASSKGDDAICGFMEALDESGNSALISAFQALMKEDFGDETKSDLGEAKRNDSNPQTPKSQVLATKGTITNELSSSGAKLIDKIISRMDDCFMKQLEGHLVEKASKIANVPEFCSHLANEKVLDEADIQLTTLPEAHEGELTEKTVKAACSKRAIGSLVVALQLSGNEPFLHEAIEWLETGQARIKNYPISVKSLSSTRSKEVPTTLRSSIFEQAALPDGLTKLGTFKCQQSTAIKGNIREQFNKEKLIACAADGTLTMWSLEGKDEEPIKIANDNVVNVTCFQFDEEILVLGTAYGNVHLFDTRTLEEKSSVSLREAVISLKFVEASLAILTSAVHREQMWWIDISRPNMQLLNPRSLIVAVRPSNPTSGVCTYKDNTFRYRLRGVYVYDTRSGKLITDDRGDSCYLLAPVNISTLMVGDLMFTERVAVAGCVNGMILIWNTSKLTFEQEPVKTFEGHTEAVLSLCSVRGHLLSVDQSGKLLMWFEHEKVAVAPRVLMDKSNVTYLAAHKRWFASCSSEDDVINVWTLPELWIRTG